ncbi:hypothetical protein CFELI_00620 [Corynebacterium felinum]|nr:hypothetical protein CFELI_00620 [Corynebacterium felinum]
MSISQIMILVDSVSILPEVFPIQDFNLGFRRELVLSVPTSGKTNSFHFRTNFRLCWGETKRLRCRDSGTYFNQSDVVISSFEVNIFNSSELAVALNNCTLFVFISTDAVFCC